VHTQVDGDIADALVAARHAVRFRLNLQPDLVKVREDASLAVQELPVLCGAKVGRSIGNSPGQQGRGVCVEEMGGNESDHWRERE